MSYYGYGEYVSVADKKAKNLKVLAKLKKKNPSMQPVVISGRKMAETWWGKSWNDNLERYTDYENRIGRGRSYIRNSAVLDLKIVPGAVTAMVQGSGRTPYVVGIQIKDLEKKSWEKIVAACEGKISSLQELIDGKFPKALRELFNEKGEGLFPAPKEIRFSCSCPDYASMCKHVAAALYGVGVRLDEDPGLFFALRNVDIDALISKAVTQKAETLLKKSVRKSSRVIAEDDVSALFGLDMGADESAPMTMVEKKAVKGINKALENDENKSIDVLEKNPVKRKAVQKAVKGEPKKTRVVEPKKTANGEPKKTRVVESKKTANGEPKKTRIVEPKKTADVEPNKTRVVELKKTADVEPKKTRVVESKKTADVEPNKKRIVEPKKTTKRTVKKVSLPVES